MVYVRDQYNLVALADAQLWLQKIEQKCEHSLPLLRTALTMATQYVSKNLELYQPKFQQGISIVAILQELNLDQETLAAGLLFNLVHDARLSLDTVSGSLGTAVTQLITGVIKMDAIRNLRQKSVHTNFNTQLQADKLRKMLLAMVEDVRVVLIRLAEHLCELHNVRTASHEAQVELANETLSIYAPLANRLGVGQIKWEMEDSAFHYLHPDTYKYIAHLLDARRVDREAYIKNVVHTLQEFLNAEHITAEVVGRAKHIYSIWRKMQRKHLDYDEIYDIRAVRIFTEKIADCYAALGIVHSLWQHIPREFDDYIATPKQNGYQSLHTAVIGPDGQTVEVQIRTYKMHKDAELGVAAHWRYKEGVAHDASFESKIAWLRQLLAWQDELVTGHQLLEELKTDITEDRVYVLTPKGEVKDLPEGSTPLDFAYQVHTDIGHRCRGAKVNGRIVNLNYKLVTGDQVVILTGKNANPSRDWLNQQLHYLHTARSRAKVQNWFKKLDFTHNAQAGREILQAEYQRLNLKPIDLAAIADKLGFKTAEDVYAALGRGDLKLSHIWHAAAVSSATAIDDEDRLLPFTRKYTELHTTSTGGGVVVAGEHQLLTTMAGCCKPIPGDLIIGYVTQGRGVSIHTQNCSNINYIQEIRAERLLEAHWQHGSIVRNYAVDIVIDAIDRPGLLRDITALLSSERINIVRFSTALRHDDSACIMLTIQIASVEDLGGVLHKLQNLPQILNVKRMK